MKIGDNVTIDLPTLLETRLLVQANSGGGKSWVLRRLLEQTAGSVQQLVIDPEGEFATLREKFDYVIAAPRDGDAVASPATAALLGRRLLETGVSAILDIYDLKVHERQQFVRRFLDALINAPRNLWKPVMVVLDEAHTYCPQTGSAEASSAVIDVATRGRKRGQCLVLATQRLSKLHKDAAAEMLNKMIGRTGLDVDVKRAADELGMTSREAMDQLRGLTPGEFFAFGPALSPTVRRCTVGAVSTRHPKSGDRLMAPPPAASKRVLASLAKLADLQREAEEEAQTIEELKRELAATRRKLTVAERRSEIQITGTTGPIAVAKSIATNARPDPRLGQAIALARKIVALDSENATPGLARTLAHRPVALAAPAGVDGLRSGAIKILRELAARSPAGYSRAQVGALTRFSHRGGTFGTYISNLRARGLIEERGGLMYAHASAFDLLGADVPKKPTTHEDVMAQWRSALRAGAFAMLEAIVSAGAGGMSRLDIASAIGMAASGGTFGTYLSNLRSNGLVSEKDGHFVANDILFPGR